MENKQSEAKLMKLLSVLQDHLSRDREDEQALMDFQLEFSKAIETHKLQIKKILKTLDQNKQVKTYLTKHLYEGVDNFYKNSLKLTTDTGDAILQEGRQAESRYFPTIFSASNLSEIFAVQGCCVNPSNPR